MKTNSTYSLKYLVGLALVTTMGIAPVTAFSTVTITDDATGGDCTTIGIWAVATKTCTLSTTVFETIQIGDDGVTLEGAGYTISSFSGTGSGVLLSNRTGVTVQNLEVTGFYDGIQLVNSNQNTLKGNTVSENIHAGILLRSSDNNTLVDNEAKNTTAEVGIWIWGGSDSNAVTDNRTSGNAGYGIFIDNGCNENIITENFTSEDLIGIRLNSNSDRNKIYNNTMSDHRTWGMDIWTGNNDDNEIYNNNFINNSNSPQIRFTGGNGNVFNLDAPIGGNYWSDYDEPVEGCNDASPSDGFCDTPYTFPYGLVAGQDNLPWTVPNGWLTTEVGIDIKPGSDPNCVNINGHGVIPVAVLGSVSFDVSNIDRSTLSFGGLEVRVRGRRGPLCSMEYSNEDAYLDLVCHFEDDAGAWSPGDGDVTLTGELLDGTSFEGTDAICIVP